jgi:hypothetical protein
MFVYNIIMARNTQKRSRSSTNKRVVKRSTTRRSERVAKRSGRVAKRSTRVAKRSARVAKRSARVSKRSGRVAKRSARVAKRSARVAKRSTRVSKRSGRVAKRSGRVAKRSGRVAKRSGRVAKRSGRVAKRSARVAKRSARVAKRSGRVAKRSARVAKRSERVAKRRMTPPPIPKNVRGEKVAQTLPLSISSAVDEILRAPVGSKSDDNKDIESFLAGIKSTEKSAPYILDELFKENEEGYKKQGVKVKKSLKGKSSGRGKSPYNLFVAKQSPIIRAANPGLKQPEIMKLIGAEWKKQKKQ